MAALGESGGFKGLGQFFKRGYSGFSNCADKGLPLVSVLEGKVGRASGEAKSCISQIWPFQLKIEVT